MNRFMLLAAALLIGSAAEAATEVGTATSITTEVKGNADGKVRALNTGDQVFQEEIIETDAKGVGQFEFLDNTRLAIGPGSSVKLDRFVYGADRSATTVTIQLTKGAFRFISGKSASTAYQIATPTATIGVRGTVFDVFVAEDGEMAVAMINGGVDVCARRGGCQAHNVVGRFLHLTPAGVISIRNRWDGTFLRTVSFTAALPFLARQNMLLPGFRATGNIAGGYLNAVPRHLLTGPALAPTRLVPQMLPKLLPNFGPARGQKEPRSKSQGLRLPNLFR